MAGNGHSDTKRNVVYYSILYMRNHILLFRAAEGTLNELSAVFGILPVSRYLPVSVACCGIAHCRQGEW